MGPTHGGFGRARPTMSTTATTRTVAATVSSQPAVVLPVVMLSPLSLPISSRESRPWRSAEVVTTRPASSARPIGASTAAPPGTRTHTPTAKRARTISPTATASPAGFGTCSSSTPVRPMMSIRPQLHCCCCESSSPRERSDTVCSHVGPTSEGSASAIPTAAAAVAGQCPATGRSSRSEALQAPTSTSTSVSPSSPLPLRPLPALRSASAEAFGHLEEAGVGRHLPDRDAHSLVAVLTHHEAGLVAGLREGGRVAAEREPDEVGL